MAKEIIEKFQEALNKSYKKHFKNEKDSISLMDLDKIEKLIETDQTLRGTIKKLLKNCDGSVINDKTILLLSNFYLKRNEKEDLETAKECLEKVINKKNPEFLFQKTKINEKIGKQITIEEYQEIAYLCYPEYIDNIKYCIDKIIKLSSSDEKYKNFFNSEFELLNQIITNKNNIKNINSDLVASIIKTYFEFAETAINNILEEYKQKKENISEENRPNKEQELNNILQEEEQELNNIFRNIGHAIDGIKGDFSEINGKDRSKLFEKDEFFTFYNNIEFKLLSEFSTYLENFKNNQVIIDMLKTFSEKGSYVGFHKFDAWYTYGNEEYKNSKKEDMKKIAESEYKMNDKDQNILQRVGQFIFEEENIDINKIKKFFKDYKSCLEDKKQFDGEYFRTATGELIRFFENRLISKNISIENIKDFKEEIEELCDMYPYGFNYGNYDVTDYYNIILDKKEFLDIFESFKEENLSELTNDLKSKSFSNFCNDLTSKDEISKKLEKFFEKIIENEDKFEYYIFELNRADLEKLENLCPKYKGKTKELLEKKLLEKFEKNIDSINKLLNKNEINEDIEKEVNRTLGSLIRTTDIILKEKFVISEKNEEKLTNLVNNLENKNIVTISTIEVYKNTLQELENLFPNLKGRTEKIIENRKSIEFEYNLNFINNLLAQEINENEEKSLDKETKEKIDNLMNFIKKATNEKIENLKIYKKELKILFINLKESKNKELSDTINNHKEELEKLKNLFNENEFNLSSRSFAQR